MAQPTHFDMERILRRNYVKWIPCANGFIPEGAVTLTSPSGARTMVARAEYHGGIIPGKVIAGQAQCLIGTSNKEIPINKYEVLADPMGALTWVPYTPETKSYAVYGGHREKKPDHTLFVARAACEGVPTPGKLFKEESHCSVPFNGGEHSFHAFDILVYN